MKTTIEQKSASLVKIKIDLSVQELENFKIKAAENLAKTSEFKGFRKGKMPLEFLLKQVKPEVLKAKTLALAIQESYNQAIRENSLKAISQPEIKILSTEEQLKNQGLSFEIHVEVIPKITLPDYRQIAKKTKKRKITISEKEVQESIKWLQKSRAKRSQVMRKAQKGDFVEIEFFSPDFSENSWQKDAFILGQGRLLPNLEKEIEGMAPQEKKKVTVEFPTDFHRKELAGKKSQIEIKLISVQQVELPELNDEFAKSLGSFQTFKELEKSITEGLRMEKEIAERSRVREEILDNIFKEADFMPPLSLVEREKNQLLEEIKNKVEKELGLSFDDYLKNIRKTSEQLKESFKEVAKKRVAYQILLNEIALAENIEAEPEEINLEIKEFLKRFKDPKEAEKNIDLDTFKDYIKERICQEKVLALLENLSEKE
jgi:trigger factor